MGILELTVPQRPDTETIGYLRSAAPGGNLRDDATVLCIDWFGPRWVRNATGGASDDRATTT